MLRVVGDAGIRDERGGAGGLGGARERRKQAGPPGLAGVLRGRESDRKRAAVDEAADLVGRDDRGSASKAVRLDRRSLLRPEAAEPVAGDQRGSGADALAWGDPGAGVPLWLRARLGAVGVDAEERRIRIGGNAAGEDRLRGTGGGDAKRSEDERGQKERAEQPAMTAGDQVPIMTEARSGRHSGLPEGGFRPS